MLKITPKQLNELLEIIKYCHLGFIVRHVGQEFLTKEDLKLLKKFGVDVEKIDNLDSIGISFKFGILSEALSKSQGDNLNYEDFKKYLKSGKFIPLSQQENDVLNSIKKQTTNDIKGLSDKAGKEVGDRILTEERRQQMIEAITEEEQKAIQERKSMKQLIMDIQDRTEDWGRDFSKIVSYRSHDAFENGRAIAMKRNYNESDPSVFKIPFAGSCKHCIRVFLTNGIGSAPRIFKLSELLANGNNIGVKANDYKPIVGAMHPFCRCTLRYVDLNVSEWSDKEQDFVLKKNWEPRVKNINAPKVIVTKD